MIGTATTVIRPATAIDRLLIAPSTSPSSSAFAVPIACAEVPSASPFGDRFLDADKLKPAICNDITEDSRQDDADDRHRHDPAGFLRTPIPIAVVMDFGSRET